MQANNDLSSRRAVSEVLPTDGELMCPVETKDSGKPVPGVLFIAVSLRLTEWIGVSDFEELVAEFGFSAVKICPSKP